MYAVIETGGKQYRVTKGQQLKIERLPEEVNDAVYFSNVLLINEEDGKLSLGAPRLNNACVVGKVVQQGRHKKIKILKFKRRKHHMKRRGHRQYFTQVEIIDIQLKQASN